MAAEYVVQPLVFQQSGDHVVESGLQFAHFAAVVDRDLHVQVTVLHFPLGGFQAGHRFDQRPGHRIGARQTPHHRNSRIHREHDRQEEPFLCGLPDPDGAQHRQRHGAAERPQQDQPTAQPQLVSAGCRVPGQRHPQNRAEKLFEQQKRQTGGAAPGQGADHADPDRAERRIAQHRGRHGDRGRCRHPGKEHIDSRRPGPQEHQTPLLGGRRPAFADPTRRPAGPPKGAGKPDNKRNHHEQRRDPKHDDLIAAEPVASQAAAEDHPGDHHQAGGHIRDDERSLAAQPFGDRGDGVPQAVIERQVLLFAFSFRSVAHNPQSIVARTARKAPDTPCVRVLLRLLASLKLGDRAAGGGDLLAG
ncbi:MAG TPA: hypothetical protein VML93_05050 [Mycobacterium sp.]|nr:hypothetical protein [Mycobacterium sp.]HTQ16707.1 hypothetical protein [Mycobacterium sp.]